MSQQGHFQHFLIKISSAKEFYPKEVYSNINSVIYYIDILFGGLADFEQGVSFPLHHHGYRQTI
jgi:hypothetical protein